MDTQGVAPAGQRGEDEAFWPKGWWSIVDFKIGIIPLPGRTIVDPSKGPTPPQGIPDVRGFFPPMGPKNGCGRHPKRFS